MEHAKTFPPSGSKAWISCPAWQGSDATHPSAAEGTRLHGVAEDLFFGRGEQDPEDVMKLSFYVCYIMDLKKIADKWSVEEKLTMKTTGEFGTGDFIALVRLWGLTFVHVVDLKTGSNVVSPAENSQLRLYGLGALEKYKLSNREINKTIVVSTIHQHGKARSWAEPALSLLDWQESVLKPAVEARRIVLKEEDPTVKGNPDEYGACFFCAHKETCTAKHGNIEDELCELS